MVTGGEPGDSYICIENWECNGWSECVDGEQTRNCVDSSQCGTTLDKPPLVQECESETQGGTNFFTGAVTGITEFAKTKPGVATLIGAIILLVGGILITTSKKRKH